MLTHCCSTLLMQSLAQVTVFCVIRDVSPPVLHEEILVLRSTMSRKTCNY